MGRKSPENVKEMAMKALDADKAVDIEALDLRGLTSIADYMIVATGTSSRHVNSLAVKLAERLSILGLKDIRLEGQENSDWVIVDAGDVIIHLFREEVRDFYNIEKIWNTPPRASVELVTAR
jgi:ribosome-associated protein